MNEQLNTLAERFWDRAMEESPSWATILGDHRFESGAGAVGSSVTLWWSGRRVEERNLLVV